MFAFTSRRESVSSSLHLSTRDRGGVAERPAVAARWVTALAVAFAAVAAAPAHADYVGSLTNRIFIDPATLSAVADGFDNGDEFAYILETTPRDTGSDIGMAAWATVYIPPGVEVIGASFVEPAGGGLYSQKNAEPADNSYFGCGKRNCRDYKPDTGTTRLDNASVGEVNQDTGIFYSTDARTQNQLTEILPQLTPTGPKTKPAHVFNQWDYDQLRAFGISAALSDNGGTGNTPLISTDSGSTWKGTGSMVAGPLTRYTNDHNPACNGGAACTGTAAECAFAADVQCEGPWQRIAYPGSRFGGSGTITPSIIQGAIGNNSVVTALGATLNAANPLPASTNAVRFVHGTRELGELEYSRIAFRITDATAFTTSLDTDTFCLESTGGDTSEIAAKDSPWRYYEPEHECFQELAAQDDNAILLKATTHVNGGLSGGEFLQPGDVISYTITFTNIGGSTLTNVLLSDTEDMNIDLLEPGDPDCAYADYDGDIPGPSYNAGSATTNTATWAAIPSLSPGASVTVYMCGEVDGGANDGDLVENTGHVTYTLPDDSEEMLHSTATGTVFETANVNIAVVKSDSPDPIGQGDNLVYTLEISNAGPETANNIVVTDELDPDTTYVSDDGGCMHSAGIVTCNIASLASGASTTIHITVTVSPTAPTAGTLQDSPCDGTEDLCNNVSVTQDENDTDLGDNSDSEPTDVVECLTNADCPDDGVFCNGDEICVSGTCGSEGDPCTGAGVCSVCNEDDDNCFGAGGTVCRTGNGICDPQETCTGTSSDCPTDGFSDTDTLCRNGSGICDPAEFCDGAGDCPADAFAKTATLCREGSGICDPPENCDGAGGCPADGFASTATVCRAGNGICDPAENCDGSGSCATNVFSDTDTLCRDGNGVCDPPENCDGAGSCATNAFSDSGTVCRAGGGICDPAETCDGSGACVADGFASTATLCREGNGVCDPPENCDGAGACPADGFASTATVCRAGNGICDPAENCDGSGSCATNVFSDTDTLCRDGNGVCDPPENCDGAGSCASNSFSDTDTLCRTGNGVCDPPENCTGTGTCATNVFSDTDTLCRASTDQCDAAEFCNGAGSCSPDLSEPDGTACNDGLYCTDPDECDSGSCSGPARDCGDGVDCTDDACNETLNTCTHDADNDECIDGDPCTSDICNAVSGCVNDQICGADICRTAGYWSTHGGYGRPNSYNVTQAVLDAIGGIDVCGEHIDSTSNVSPPWVEGLGLDSALEGLCVAVQGEQVRQLYRQLVAAGLNCAISGVSDCDSVVLKYIDLSFSECSDLCDTGVVQQGGPTIGDCISQIDCFNNGGQWYEGKCVFGYCESNPGQGCGGDNGSCPGGGACVPFDENCHNAPLCNEGLGVCPKKAPASSVKACREAKANDCTIDSCPP